MRKVELSLCEIKFLACCDVVDNLPIRKYKQLSEKIIAEEELELESQEREQDENENGDCFATKKRAFIQNVEEEARIESLPKVGETEMGESSASTTPSSTDNVRFGVCLLATPRELENSFALSTNHLKVSLELKLV